LAAVEVVEVGDRQGQEVGDHQEVEDCPEVEGCRKEEGHWGAPQVPDLNKQEEAPSWWETLLKYLMENAKGHNCSFHNGRFIGA